MAAKRWWAKAALVTLGSLTGCCSWCERHCGLTQPAAPVSCCQPCTPCYQAPACCPAPSYNPCATPAPAYAPPAQPWVAPVPQSPPR
jgi:hypothetical protein